MALQLIKLNIVASSTVGVDPTISRFFYITTAETAAGATLTIDAGDFFDDTGAAATALPPLAANNSYFNVYINGVLQMEDMSTYTSGPPATGSLEIDVPVGSDPLLADTPVVLEVANYSPTVDTTIAT